MNRSPAPSSITAVFADNAILARHARVTTMESFMEQIDTLNLSPEARMIEMARLVNQTHNFDM